MSRVNLAGMVPWENGCRVVNVGDPDKPHLMAAPIESSIDNLVEREKGVQEAAIEANWIICKMLVNNDAGKGVIY